MLWVTSLQVHQPEQQEQRKVLTAFENRIPIRITRHPETSDAPSNFPTANRSHNPENCILVNISSSLAGCRQPPGSQHFFVPSLMLSNVMSLVNVKFPTRGLNTLDLILTNLNDYYDTPIKLPPFGLSDHVTIEVQPLARPGVHK